MIYLKDHHLMVINISNYHLAALKYAGIIKTLMATSFYAAILPIGIFFSLASLIL